MKKCLIIYSTTDGHTKKICEHIIDQLKGLQETTLMTISDTSQEELTKYDNIIVGASIRYGKHKKEVHEFIKKNIDAINSKNNYFFSVNAVARKDNKNTPETNPYVIKFLKQTAWNPTFTGVFGGKVDYPKYRFFDKHIIRFIMWLTNGPTDITKSYEFTDWNSVTTFSKKIAI